MAEAPAVSPTFSEILERIRTTFGHEAARGFHDGYFDKPSGNGSGLRKGRAVNAGDDVRAHKAEQCTSLLSLTTLSHPNKRHTYSAEEASNMLRVNLPRPSAR